ncbi:adenosylcobinamide-GDP ribazoletransferase [Pleomorphomonas sp. NRK KF1]|uniref:adenosylcobinamide-GDP ribazoletransferase n=1 Tax=Pleomorphomonas sp. NRK KF1 TaxID=2943000 RepID=UPI0020433352|nr:adenosylcobinamide-GDP ribazoletransferase [Pleomorphomonas sp. NRK KF1]MCM5552148.1 adenosylcobinamide-GDP ribazoletransferase [Pleomorphomonas sp. NRK KF1]
MTRTPAYKRRMLRDELLHRLADLGASLRFFSRLPVPQLGRRDDTGALPDLPRAAAAVPFAGFLIALPAALIGLGASAAGLPDLLVGLLVVAALVAPTGALHEDGLADSADGLIGGASAEKRLLIMKDSRIGTFAGLALVLSTLVRASAYGALFLHPVAGLFAVLGGGALSRLSMTALWAALPNARPDGLAARLGQPDRRSVAIGAGVTVLLLSPLPALVGAPAVLLGIAFAALAALAFGALAREKIGGQTGDILGATQVLTEAAFLIGLLIGR